MLRSVTPGIITGSCRFDQSLVFSGSRKRRLLPENAKGVIAVLFPYYAGDFPKRNVARYACANDYHKIAGEILAETILLLKAEYPGEMFVPFVDDSPIREVMAANKCSLGVVGRHGMIIHETYGSRVFIGTIVTTLPLSGTWPAAESPRFCKSCGRCINACPTGALSFDGPLKKELCRSYLTQKKGALSDRESAEIKAGGLVFGCDICADACPLNKHVPITGIQAFLTGLIPVLSRENIDAALREKPYGWRGRKLLLRNLSILEE